MVRIKQDNVLNSYVCPCEYRHDKQYLCVFLCLLFKITRPLLCVQNHIHANTGEQQKCLPLFSGKQVLFCKSPNRLRCNQPP